MTHLPLPTLAPVRIVADYRLQTRIGSGAMADVYRVTRAHDRVFGRSFVLKRMREELASQAEFVQQFNTEARLAMTLSHPHIARALDVIDHGQVHALVFDYAPGADFLKILEMATRRGERIAPAVVVAIIAKVASALSYLHAFRGLDSQCGWVHRDVSPANIILSHGGAVQLIDFGIAQPITLTRTVASRRGKIGYLAPETILNGEISEQSDIFALATVLWEALTLRRLFKTGDDLETLRNIATVAVEARFARHAWVPQDLLDIIRCGLAPNPDNRFPSMYTFKRALRTWIAQTAVAIGPTEIGQMCRDLVPVPYEEVLASDQPVSTTSEFYAPVDLSSLESLIDAIDSVPSRDGLAALVQGQSSWLPETHRVKSAEESREWSRNADASSDVSFDALSADDRRAGELDHFDPTTFPALLMSLHHRGFSGVISVRSLKRVKQIHFQSGYIAKIASNIKNERLATRLERKGFIEAATRMRALELQRDTGMRIGEALVATAPGCAEAVEDALATEVVERLTEMLRWTSGEIAFESWEKDSRAEEANVLHETAIVTAAAVRAAWTTADYMLMLEPWADATVIPLEPPWPEPGWLNAEERDCWRLLHRPTTVRTASGVSGAEAAGRVAYLGLVTLKHTFMQVPRARPPEPTVSVVAASTTRH